MKKKRDMAMGIRGNRRFWTDVFWVVNWNGGMTRGFWVGSEWDGVVAVPHWSPQRDLPSCHLWIRFPQTQCPAPPSAPAHVHTPQWVPDPHGSHGSLSVWNCLTEHSGKSVADSEEGSGSEEDEEDQADLGKRRGPSFFFFFCFECCVPPRQPLHLPSAFVQKPTRRGMRRMKVSWVTPSLSLYGVLMPQWFGKLLV